MRKCTMYGPYKSIKFPEDDAESPRSNSMQSNIVKDKIIYILENTLQREAYKKLKTQEERVLFFKDHFIMRDHESRNLLSYLNCESPEDFEERINILITKIEQQIA
ncbi:hypothetical protein LVD15_00670 [Fulvivirga maritima]|uniref:hypothetical protein n=1 Tax=Fulvivirga maritima TaxID=2904247 RepID=UPI001F17C923|nr:hypothetical protein [Fulvivirga maritima]UII26982.1 hypothetical protein LVD15_00670 [Fulvivirga maritima]